MHLSEEKIVVMGSSIASIFYVMIGNYTAGLGLLSVPILAFLIMKYKEKLRANKKLMMFLKKVF